MIFKWSLHIEEGIVLSITCAADIFPVYNLSLNFDGVLGYTEEIGLIKSFIIIVFCSLSMQPTCLLSKYLKHIYKYSL